MLERRRAGNRFSALPSFTVALACAMALVVASGLLCLTPVGQETAYASVTAGSTAKAKVKKPAKATIAKIKSASAGKAKVTVKKVSGAKGYQYKVALNKALTKSAKSKVTSKRSCTFSSLKRGKTYYAKVRAYKVKANGKKVWGRWSAVKKVKVKKASKRVYVKGDGRYLLSLGPGTGNKAYVSGNKVIVIAKGNDSIWYWKRVRTGSGEFDWYEASGYPKEITGTYVFKLNNNTSYPEAGTKSKFIKMLPKKTFLGLAVSKGYVSLAAFEWMG